MLEVFCFKPRDKARTSTGVSSSPSPFTGDSVIYGSRNWAKHGSFFVRPSQNAFHLKKLSLHPSSVLAACGINFGTAFTSENEC